MFTLHHHLDREMSFVKKEWSERQKFIVVVSLVCVRDEKCAGVPRAL